jgi:hypothetical protein
MAKINWNRPNGGYESEPWRKAWTDISKCQKILSKAKDHNLWGCESHPATVKLVSYSSIPTPVLWCLQCNKHLKSLSREDYQIYKEVNGVGYYNKG